MRRHRDELVPLAERLPDLRRSHPLCLRAFLRVPDLLLHPEPLDRRGEDVRDRLEEVDVVFREPPRLVGMGGQDAVSPARPPSGADDHGQPGSQLPPGERPCCELAWIEVRGNAGQQRVPGLRSSLHGTGHAPDRSRIDSAACAQHQRSRVIGELEDLDEIGPQGVVDGLKGAIHDCAEVAVLHGERITAVPSLRATAALGYLIVAGSIVGYSAYQFLLSRVRPTLAASYAYVNPVVAVGLGAAVAGESVAPRAVGALALILGGVAMLAIRRQAA